MSIDRSTAVWAAVVCMAVAPVAGAQTTASAAYTLELGGTPTGQTLLTDGSVPAQVGTLQDVSGSGQRLSWALSASGAQSGRVFGVQASVGLSAASTDGGLSSSGGAAATLSFVDTFVIDCATCIVGTRGTLQLSVPDLAAVMAAAGGGGQASGDLVLSVADGGFGAVQARADTERTIELSVQGDNLPLPPGVGPADSSAWWTRTERERWSDTGSGGTAFLPVSQSATDGEISFVFGQPIRVVLSMSVGAGLGLEAWMSSGDASFEAQLWREAALSLELPEVLAVHDAAGVAVSGYSALGVSGLDYAAASAVPEPAAAALWLGGLVLIGAAGARRRMAAGRPG